MSGTAFRRIEARDIPAILQIQSSSKEAAQWSGVAYARLCEGSASERGWVAERDARLLGFLVARQIAREMEILNLAVDSQVRRCGIGTGLLRQCVFDAAKNGVEKIYLEVRSSNVAAQAFYQGHGFASEGIRRNYYANPVEDAMLLSCSPSLTFMKNLPIRSWGAPKSVIASPHVILTPKEARMPLTAQDIPGDLMSNEEFRRLAQQHSQYEEQLQQLTRQTYLSSEDILLEGQLKKMKLRLKDQMQQLIAHRRREQSQS